MTAMKKTGFQKATKQQSFLRMGLYGPSGSGKTYTSLRMATGIARVASGRIAFICSERGSAAKYADRFDFDVLDLEERTVDAYVEAIQMAAAEKFSILIIDSSSHAWQELLEEVDKLAAAKFKGNKWSAWSEGTPKQKAFIDAILHYPGHVIVTMRARTEWDTDKDSKKPVRVGLAPEQGKGIEYEYDLLMSISADHVAIVEKDRTGKYQDKIITKPGEDFGADLAKWLLDGAPRVDPPAKVAPATQEQRKRMLAALTTLGMDPKASKEFLEQLNGGAPLESGDDYARVQAELDRRVVVKNQAEAAMKQAAPSSGEKPTEEAGDDARVEYDPEAAAQEAAE